MKKPDTPKNEETRLKGLKSLEILDINGRKVLSYPLTESTGQVQLPARRLAPGTYLYQIIAANRKAEAKKIVIR